MAPHGFDAFEGLERSQEHGCTRARRLANDVGADVDAVAEVGIEPGWSPEHRVVSLGLSAMRVGAGIRAVTQIGFDFDDPTDQTFAARELAHQMHAHEIGCDREAGAIKECASQAAAALHGWDASAGPAGTLRPRPRASEHAGSFEGESARRYARSLVSVRGTEWKTAGGRIRIRFEFDSNWIRVGFELDSG